LFIYVLKYNSPHFSFFFALINTTIYYLSILLIYIKNKNLEWFPRMRAMSLDSYAKVEEDNELNNIKNKMEVTNNLVLLLSKQLTELKKQVIIDALTLRKEILKNKSIFVIY
jgi:hypothetical protein